MNPFELVYDALWTLAYTPVMADLVRPGNLVRFDQDDNPDPMKDPIASADLPELVLTTAGVPSINLHASSCSSKIVRRYQFLLSTGDFRLNFRLYPVEWALVCAMTNWKEVLTGLTWRDYAFVKHAKFVSVTEGESVAAQNRGIKGWSAIWTCDVDMYLRTQDLIDFNEGSNSSSGS